MFDFVKRGVPTLVNEYRTTDITTIIIIIINTGSHACKLISALKLKKSAGGVWIIKASKKNLESKEKATATITADTTVWSIEHW